MLEPLGIDRLINSYILSVNGNPLLGWFFWIVSLSVILVVTFSAFYFFSVRKDRDMTCRIVIGSVVVYLVTELIKNIVLRLRPDATDSFSFPSSHTATAFLLALLLPADRKYKVLLLFWAALVAVSRLWLQKHWFTDVLAGAAIGITFGYFLKHYRRKTEQPGI